MNIGSIASVILRSRYPHALAVGVLWALAFPNFGIPGAAWAVPGLMLAVAMGSSPAQTFRLGFLTGLMAALLSLYWLLLIPVAFFPLLGWLALSAYVAIYAGAWTWLMSNLWRRLADAGSTMESLPRWVQVVGWTSWGRRVVWALCGAMAWAGLEWMRAHFLGGFPWNLLAVSQFELIPLIQVASVIGVYGVSFVVVWFSLGLFCAMLHLLRAPTQRYAWLADLGLPLGIVLIAFAWGWARVNRDAPGASVLRVAVIQPSIPQTMIWDTTANAERFAEVIELTHEAVAEQPDLLIWPEAAVPELLRWHEETFETITGIARSNEVWMIIGADDAEPGATPEAEPRYYNSAWLISPEGKLRQTYRKQQLVAFGEEVPFSHWLPFLKWFTPITGSFTRGTGPVTFVIPDRHVPSAGPTDALTVAPSICFEDVFPALIRRSVLPETDLLVNLTNDGWFREGAAQRQQAAAAVFRAVETGRPLVRCTNNGLTCWVDPLGRIVEEFKDDSGSIYGPGWAIFSVEIGDAARTTVYQRAGNLFAWASFAVTLGVLGWSLPRKRRPESGLMRQGEPKP